MKIKLVQSGGLLPITKEAETEVNWSKEDSDQLLDQIEVKDGASSPVRDGIDHTIEIGGREVPVNLSKASGKYVSVINELKRNLKIVKT